jgi:hypothetical protein
VADQPSFARDIRPLFRDLDVRQMGFLLDLSDYQDVRRLAEAVYPRLADGSMPCDQPWPAEHVDRFRRWIDHGMPP